jgi:hypothetical protein
LDIDPPSVWALLVFFAACRLAVLGADLFLAEQSLDYLDTYLRYRHLPLIVQQLLGHLQGMTSVLALAVMAVLCRAWGNYRWVVFAWLVLEFALLTTGMGARTQFVLLFLTALFSYHYLAGRSTYTLLLAGFGVVVVFSVLAFCGSTAVLAFLLRSEAVAGASSSSRCSPMLTMWAVGCLREINQHRLLERFTPDFKRPQQLMPFEKPGLPAGTSYLLPGFRRSRRSLVPLPRHWLIRLARSAWRGYSWCCSPADRIATRQ